MDISACYIVKNEAENLPRSVRSLQGCFDELIVADTGSTDNTPAVAKDLGAKVYHYEWQGDFAAARNFALSKAKGDWILFFDADEYFAGGRSIREYLTKLEEREPQAEAVVISLSNIDELNLPPMKVIRMFRNRSDIRYTGVVHELVGRAEGRLNIVDADGMQFIHTGYVQANMQWKIQRNLDLIHKDIEKNGDNPKYYYYLAECHFGLRQYDKSLYYILKALDTSLKYYYELGNYYHILLESMRQLNYPAEEMEQVCAEAIRIFPDMPEFYGEQGMIVSSMWHLDEALELFWQCIERYDSPLRKKQDCGYFDDRVMGIVYARMARIYNLKEDYLLGEMAARIALKISQGQHGREELAEVEDRGYSLSEAGKLWRKYMMLAEKEKQEE